MNNFGKSITSLHRLTNEIRKVNLSVLVVLYHKIQHCIDGSRRRVEGVWWNI